MKIFDILEFLKRKWEEYNINFDWDENEDGVNIVFHIKDNEAVLHLDKNDKFSGIKIDWKKIDDIEIKQKFQELIGLVDRKDTRITELGHADYGCCLDGSMVPWGGVCVAGVGMTEEGEYLIQDFLKDFDERNLDSEDEMFRIVRHLLSSKDESIQKVFESKLGSCVSIDDDYQIKIDFTTIDFPGSYTVVIINMNAEEYNRFYEWFYNYAYSKHKSAMVLDTEAFLMDMVEKELRRHQDEHCATFVTKSNLSTIVSTAVVYVGMEYQYQTINKELNVHVPTGCYQKDLELINEVFKDSSIERKSKYAKLNLF